MAAAALAEAPVAQATVVDPGPPVAPAAPAATLAAPAIDRNLLLRAIDLQHQGQVGEAERLLRRYLGAFPADPAALYSLAVILLKQPDVPAAMALLDAAVQAAGHFAPLWFAHGTALQGLGRREEALASYDRALALQPDYSEVLINSGVLLRDLHRHGLALERFNRVLITQPNHQTALANCAVLLTEFKRSEDAQRMLERLLTLNPGYDYGVGLLAYERLHVCDWHDADALKQRVLDGLRAGQRSCKSLGLMALSDSAEDHQRCARLFTAQRYPKSAEPLWRGEVYRHERIRLAYVSPDLREHPVGHLMAGIFERHDRSRFETLAISIGSDDGSLLRARIQGAFEHFIDARTMGSRQIAQRMRELEVDIAVDLAGFTSDSRSEIFAQRPAPVQVNYLGYPGTLGTDYMDYILADRHVIPPEHHRFYDERVVYLPDAYLPPASGLTLAERTPSRAECGLPEDGVVFCSFNHDYKISPHMFAVWMRLLAQVPGSVLWLMSRSELSQRHLREEAQRAGIAPQRLVFAQRVPRVEDHLARYRQADLFLDTHPYNAHTTAADALLAGLPVVTYRGQSFPARVASSLLNAAGLPELVTDSAEAYEALALALARNPQRRADLRQRLAGLQQQRSALFDTDGFVRDLESSYIAMVRAARLGGARDALAP
ncbi:MAG TPA: tetratricopeptide repeat protein [Burkholderiaceae bacterium]|nr:tetratricopeptide repeat protein [Burkholderiaceae bacterium]HQY07553.1 tetratricopeptide repeat protein [Burkholderiaceae bacterium]